MSIKIKLNDITGYECKYVTNQRATDGSYDDITIIKEVIHTKDGGQYPRIRTIENYQRPFYVTMPQYRNHKDKKEYEDREKLIKYECNQAELPIRIQQALGYRTPNPRTQLRDVCSNPYVYYADLSVSTIIKAKYKKLYPNTVSVNRVAVLDTERDVVFGTNETILTAVTMKDRKAVGIVRWYAEKLCEKYKVECTEANIKQLLESCFVEYLSDVNIKDAEDDKKYNVHDLVAERGKDVTILIREYAGECVRDIMALVHQWQPDFLAIWNLDYDISTILRELKHCNIRPEDVFCDPAVPDRFRQVKYRQAKMQRVTNSKTISQHPADLWHVLHCQAGFYVIDAMCLFKKIRAAEGNQPSYNLDAILNRNLGIGKLKFTAADGLVKLAWHQFMQKEYPLEYMLYNLFDCISVELLDERTGDLAMTITSLSAISEYAIFSSLPKQLVDNLTYFYEEHGKIAGCCGADITTELDEYVIGLDSWMNM